MSSELHPNVTANELLDDEIDSTDVLEEIESYHWLSSIDELIKTLEEHSKVI